MFSRPQNWVMFLSRSRQSLPGQNRAGEWVSKVAAKSNNQIKKEQTWVSEWEGRTSKERLHHHWHFIFRQDGKCHYTHSTEQGAYVRQHGYIAVEEGGWWYQRVPEHTERTAKFTWSNSLSHVNGLQKSVFKLSCIKIQQLPSLNFEKKSIIGSYKISIQNKFFFLVTYYDFIF